MKLKEDDKILLDRLYTKEGFSTQEISKILKLDSKTIWNRLNRLGIKTRPRKVVNIPKNILEKEYRTNKLSLKQIGKNYGICAAAVFRKIHNYHITPRTSWEHSLLSPRFPFSGSLNEKAYMIGFRLGDLHVRQTESKDKQIRIGCNSTKIAQTLLIHNIFSKYAHVSVSKSNKIGVMSVNATLDKSFMFLLPKADKIPMWIVKNNQQMAAFVAGYTDAEGNMGVYARRAKFRLGTYDYHILGEISKFFNNHGIKNILALDRAKGTTNKRGVTLNGDFFRITVNEKASILKVYDLLWPFLKHEKRRGDFELAKRNVESRSN